MKTKRASQEPKYLFGAAALYRSLYHQKKPSKTMCTLGMHRWCVGRAPGFWPWHKSPEGLRIPNRLIPPTFESWPQWILVSLPGCLPVEEDGTSLRLRFLDLRHETTNKLVALPPVLSPSKWLCLVLCTKNTTQGQSCHSHRRQHETPHC